MSEVLTVKFFVLQLYTEELSTATQLHETKVERNCHFLASGWNCMTHRQALEGFPDTSQVPLHTNRSRDVTAAFNFVSECTELKVLVVLLYFRVPRDWYMDLYTATSTTQMTCQVTVPHQLRYPDSYFLFAMTPTRMKLAPFHSCINRTSRPYSKYHP
jgi:hypothetical protein